MLARLEDEKIASVKQALEILFALFGLDFRARVFGDGALRSLLATWVADQSYAECVTCEGHTDALHKMLRQGFAGVAGRARVVLEAGAMGLPVLLAGVDGVNGLVRRGQMSALQTVNYSGRGFPLVTAEMLAEQLHDLASHPDAYDLRPWIEEHTDERQVWGAYLRDLQGLPESDFDWQARLTRLIAAHPDRPLFARETVLELVDEARNERVIPEAYLWLTDKEQASRELSRVRRLLSEKEHALAAIHRSRWWKIRTICRRGLDTIRRLRPG